MPIVVGHNPAFSTPGKIAYRVGQGKAADRKLQRDMELERISIQAQAVANQNSIARANQKMKEDALSGELSLRNRTVDLKGKEIDLGQRQFEQKLAQDESQFQDELSYEKEKLSTDQSLAMNMTENKVIADKLSVRYTDQQIREANKLSSGISYIHQQFNDGTWTREQALEGIKQLESKLFAIKPTYVFDQETSPSSKIESRIWTDQTTGRRHFVNSKGDIEPLDNEVDFKTYARVRADGIKSLTTETTDDEGNVTTNRPTEEELNAYCNGVLSGYDMYVGKKQNIIKSVDDRRMAMNRPDPVENMKQTLPADPGKYLQMEEKAKGDEKSMKYFVDRKQLLSTPDKASPVQIFGTYTGIARQIIASRGEKLTVAAVAKLAEEIAIEDGWTFNEEDNEQ